MGIASPLDVASLPNANRLRVRPTAGGTQNLGRVPAMTRDQAEAAVMAGFETASGCFTEGCQLIGTGDMGIGNTTPSAAIRLCL